jgi:hypothetical protein
MPRVHQEHFDSAGFEDFIERYPVNARGLHRHRLNAPLFQPVRHANQIRRETIETTYRLAVASRINGYKVFAAAHVDTSRMRMHNLQLQRRNTLASGAGGQFSAHETVPFPVRPGSDSLKQTLQRGRIRRFLQQFLATNPRIG